MISNETEKLVANLIGLYIREHRIVVCDGWLNNLIDSAEEESQNKILLEIGKYSNDLTIYDIIYYFSNIFSKDKKIENGIVYTPESITDLMIDYLINREISSPLYAIDPAMGGGIFLVKLASKLSENYGISFSTIVEEYIYGIDILEENLMMARAAITILCLEYDKKYPRVLNLLKFDSLDLTNDNLLVNFRRNKFDLVITNPPYVRAKNINAEERGKLSRFSKTVFGVPDLYVPFFEIGMNILIDGGIGAYITPNTFLRSLNGKKLRSFLENESQEVRLINFENEQVFDGIQHYSTITIFKKENKDIEKPKIRKYLPVKDVSKHSNEQDWKEFVVGDIWTTTDSESQDLIKKVEGKFTQKLGDLVFQNGIATQRNNIYSFSVEKEDSKFYYFSKNDEKYCVEKEITRPFILPNNQKRDDNLRIIYPYHFNPNKNIIAPIDEEEMELNFPETLNYLRVHKEELDQRKSDKNLKFWYLYGRSQGLKQYGKRLYIPYIAKKVHTSLSTRDNEVFAAGYAIFDDSSEYLKKISKIIESNLFSLYISKVSKPYSNGFFSTAKSMISKFSIPSKSEFEKIDLDEIDEKFIEKLYE
ncbi:Eco57I restriction-modification methylase domain-containing protein [Lactococcus petauri]|uniref:Eco57I restriction-modification methylase domain-containing protein n=1 Tax=Lactococcus petauri TaxID=1940789 RepID=UPI00254BE0E9|nr:N-6 DNA methylase [Lactococcus petauri]